jgi:hypothetical protein
MGIDGNLALDAHSNDGQSANKFDPKLLFAKVDAQITEHEKFQDGLNPVDKLIIQTYQVVKKDSQALGDLKSIQDQGGLPSAFLDTNKIYKQAESAITQDRKYLQEERNFIDKTHDVGIEAVKVVGTIAALKYLMSRPSIAGAITKVEALPVISKIATFSEKTFSGLPLGLNKFLPQALAGMTVGVGTRLPFELARKESWQNSQGKTDVVAGMKNVGGRLADPYLLASDAVSGIGVNALAKTKYVQSVLRSLRLEQKALATEAQMLKECEGGICSTEWKPQRPPKGN